MSTLLGKVDELLAITDPDYFDEAQDRQSLNQDITALTFDLHLDYMGSLLNSAHPNKDEAAIPMSASVSRTGKRTPSKRLSRSGFELAPNGLPRIPMDRWNMKTPPNHTHPYLRLFEIVGAKKEHMKWHRQAKARSQRHKLKRKMSMESNATMDSVPSPPQKHHPRKPLPQHKGRTLRLSKEARICRRNENILRSFVNMLKSSRSIYGKNPETLRGVFEAVDLDSNGTLDREEFKGAMHRLGLGLQEDVIYDLANSIDVDGDGLIAYQELVTTISRFMRHSSRRHIDKASHHRTTGSRNVATKTSSFSESSMTQFLTLALSWASKRQSDIASVGEHLRRRFSASDSKLTGLITGSQFVSSSLEIGIGREGKQADVAKIALALQDKEVGMIFYHEFIDELSRQLRKYSKERRRNADTTMRKLIFEKFPTLKSIINRIMTRAEEISKACGDMSNTPETLVLLEEFFDPISTEPTLTTDEFFAILENSGITLSSSELLTVWHGLNLGERNAKRSGGTLDHRAFDARAARLHAVNDAKLISKFMVKHKHHIKQHYAAKIEKLKGQRVDNFRLQTMDRKLNRLEDGDAVEHRFMQVLQKIKSSLRLASINGSDVMRIFSLFDDDGDGQISRKEFETAVERLTVEITKEDLDSCFAILDPNGDDGIDINEFRYAWFNSGKMIRTVDHQQSESSVYRQAMLRRQEKQEIKDIEKMYRDRQTLLLSALPSESLDA